MPNGKGRTVGETGLDIRGSRCCRGQRRQFIKGSKASAAIAGTKRGAKVIAMLVRGAILRFRKNGCLTVAQLGFMPVFTITAW